jgi:hypothetical protein
LVSLNRCLSEHDARRCITQNRAAWEYDRERDDLRNVIEDRRCLRLRTPSPPQRSLVEDVTPVEKSGFRALSGLLRQVRWPDKFKTDNIDQYDGSNNPEEFIQVYQTVIEDRWRRRLSEGQFSAHDIDRRDQIMARQFT